MQRRRGELTAQSVLPAPVAPTATLTEAVFEPPTLGMPPAVQVVPAEVAVEIVQKVDDLLAAPSTAARKNWAAKSTVPEVVVPVDVLPLPPFAEECQPKRKAWAPRQQAAASEPAPTESAVSGPPAEPVKRKAWTPKSASAKVDPLSAEDESTAQ